MRLLLILNENPAGSHDDVHRALARLAQDGEIQSYYIYPFLARLSEGLSSSAVMSEIVKRAKEFQTDAILWSHTGTLKVTESALQSMRDLPSKPSMGYWDGDIYQSFYKPLPNEIKYLAAKADVAFCQGIGQMTDQLKKAGCPDIRYVPASTDPETFGKLRKQDTSILYDVIMIGNCVRSLFPWKTMPGSRWRKEMVNYLEKKLRSSFAVYGAGWSGPCAKGPVNFKEQDKLYHGSRIAIGVNNLHARYFFSNRLPIAMSCGIPILHNYESGMDEIFNVGIRQYFFKDTNEAWEKIRILLSKDQSELDSIGLMMQEFSFRYLTITEILKYMISVLRDYELARGGKKAVQIRPNPWIKVPRF